MAFTSRLYKGEPIYNDSTHEEIVLPPEGKGRGLLLGFRRTAFGAIPGAPPFPQELLIPRSEWQARIQEQEERKSRLSDIATAVNLPCKDQAQTNYCWINAPTYAFELTRVKAGQKMVILSPASAGARIKNFRNVGGWGEEGLSFIASDGLVPVDKWPANAISQSYNTPENQAIAKQNYRCHEWWELKPRNNDELVSALLHGWPVAVGLNWWGHEVTYVEPVWLDGTIAIRQRNSWGMGWGTQGYGILQGSKYPADDAVVPRVPLAA